jgi:hypothetical protein
MRIRMRIFNTALETENSSRKKKIFVFVKRCDRKFDATPEFVIPFVYRGEEKKKKILGRKYLRPLNRLGSLLARLCLY